MSLVEEMAKKLYVISGEFWPDHQQVMDYYKPVAQKLITDLHLVQLDEGLRERIVLLLIGLKGSPYKTDWQECPNPNKWTDGYCKDKECSDCVTDQIIELLKGKPDSPLPPGKEDTKQSKEWK